ncbi:ABC transporter permease [Alterinioella nitratireducens]|jgi:tungstate transport system permease protein|uniref:ABC transporter permease n=1 Tax=Alterinioella nitratireducens TaxID=2735915 RepID=UPI000C5D7AC1|nr:ABC transporter permease [Alterinioella nitratireducens]MAX73822.1 ABC transporter permease [Nioella sp.]NPD19215.1 ABC transporter permease [Alterinioella nitratireducens]
MPTLSDSFLTALGLIVSGDADLIEIVALSLRVSLTAVLLAALIGLPLGAVLAVVRFPGRGLLIVVVNALMGLPPVVVGLVVYLTFSASGPLGVLEFLYTPAAMIVAQTVLVTPIIAALARSTLADLLGEYDETLRVLGANRFDVVATLLWDGRFSLATALLAGLGRALAEVGAVMLVGGNIDHVTRVMTTAIALETSRGALPLALGLGIVLLLITLVLNAVVLGVRNRMEAHAHA